MVVDIRDAGATDLARITEIERLSYATPWSLKSFERELSLPFSKILVAETKTSEAGDSRIMAGFLCRWLVADECHVLNIAVAPEYRRQGVGFLLLNTTISEAIARQAACVTLEVRRGNLPARRLYRKLKFEERRLRRHYYGPGEDAIVMELQLPTASS
ncbi:MAG TPA: ribosomal protein S18-alanine N-acetyltransferase [Candidatus Binataceae bacterium]|nr:ribosomal protein S18-alanine N-acetyltransferase [Candidatus Binataceae bacterium]